MHSNKFVTLATLFVAFNCLYAHPVDVKDNPPIITTKYGQIQGMDDGMAYVYLGIPYALPPIGNLRWEVPTLVEPWSPQVLNATWYKPACPQPHGSTCDPAGTCPISVRY